MPLFSWISGSDGGLPKDSASERRRNTAPGVQGGANAPPPTAPLPPPPTTAAYTHRTPPLMATSGSTHSAPPLPHSRNEVAPPPKFQIFQPRSASTSESQHSKQSDSGLVSASSNPSQQSQPSQQESARSEATPEADARRQQEVANNSEESVPPASSAEPAPRSRNASVPKVQPRFSSESSQHSQQSGFLSASSRHSQQSSIHSASQHSQQNSIRSDTKNPQQQQVSTDVRSRSTAAPESLIYQHGSSNESQHSQQSGFMSASSHHSLQSSSAAISASSQRSLQGSVRSDRSPVQGQQQQATNAMENIEEVPTEVEMYVHDACVPDVAMENRGTFDAPGEALSDSAGAYEDEKYVLGREVANATVSGGEEEYKIQEERHPSQILDKSNVDESVHSPDSKNVNLTDGGVTEAYHPQIVQPSYHHVESIVTPSPKHDIAVVEDPDSRVFHGDEPLHEKLGDVNAQKAEIQEPEPVQSPDVKWGYTEEGTPAPVETPIADRGYHLSSETSKEVYSSQGIEDTAQVSEEPPEEDPSSLTALVAVPDNQHLVVANNSPTFQKFVFLGDNENVPAELKKIQEQTLRRRYEYQNHVHELECKVAYLTAQLANESMDRESAMRDVLDRSLYRPLEASLYRIGLDRDAKSSLGEGGTTSNWMTLEHRMSVLDAQMTHSVYVSLQDAKRERLESYHDLLVRDVVGGDLKLESSKANKREGSMVRRFEGLAGTIAQHFQEERACRMGAIELVTQKIKKLEHVDQHRADDFLNTIQDLRAQLAKERATREAEDRRLREVIDKTILTIKRAVLEAVGDPYI